MNNQRLAILAMALMAAVWAMPPPARLPRPYHSPAVRQRTSAGHIRLASNHRVTYRAAARPAARPRIRMTLEVQKSENPLHSGLHRRAASTQCAVPSNTHHSSHRYTHSSSGHPYSNNGYYPYTQNRLMNEGSGDEFGSGMEPKENVSTFISNKAHTDIHPHTQHGYRMMIRFKLDDEDYKAVFDTGSATTWVPIREGCDVQPEDCLDVLNYGTCDVTNKHAKGFFCAMYGSMDMENRPSATGRSYQGTFTIGSGSHAANVEGTYGVANTIRNIHFPIFGASPAQNHIGGGSIPLSPVLVGAIDTFSVYISESHTNADMPVGEVLFDGQSSKCEEVDGPKTSWMPDETSAAGFWTVVYQTVVFANEAEATEFGEGHDGTAVVDSGNPYLLLPRHTFAHLLQYITETVGEEKIRRPGSGEYEIDCDAPQFAIDIKIDGLAFRVKHKSLVEEYSPGRCRLLLFYTDGHPIFGVPFFRSACVNHDTDLKTLGVSLLKDNQ